MFSKDTFIELLKKANVVHWSPEKSSMNPIINEIPPGGFASKQQRMAIQSLVWPVGINPAWREKKKKYKKALIYLVCEVLSMPEVTAERVLLKKGEKKINWVGHILSRDWEFTHTTTNPDLVALDPKSSSEFCYPDRGMWDDWPANEFVFCLPELQRKQKNFATFGNAKLTFTIPQGTPYLAQTDVQHASGEIAFYHKLKLTKQSGGLTVTVLPA